MHAWRHTHGPTPSWVVTALVVLLVIALILLDLTGWFVSATWHR